MSLYIFVITNLTTLYNNIVNRARIQCFREQHSKIYKKAEELSSLKDQWRETINSINKNKNRYSRA